MPRAAASSGWMRTGSRPPIFDARLVAPKSSWLCSRVAGWLAISCSGKRAASGELSAFDRRHPGRMAGAVGIGETGDRRRGDLDPAARRRQRRARQGRDGRRARCRRPTARSAVPARPAPRTRRNSARCGRARPARGGSARRYARSHCRGERPSVKRVGEAEPLGQPGEDRVVVARLAVGRHGPVHRDQQRIAGGGADILALQRDRRRQHDIGMTRGRGPRRLVHDRPCPGGQKASRSRAEMLMMVERVAAGPIDQPDIRDRSGAGRCSRTPRPGCSSMSAMRATGMKSSMPLRPTGIVGSGTATRRLAGVRDRAQRKGKAAARQPDLAEHRRQHDRHPDRLLAVLGALQRHRAGDQRAAAGDAARQRDDLVCRHAADRGGPGGVFRLAVAAARADRRSKTLPADAIAVEKCRGRAAPRRPACARGRASARHRCRAGSDARTRPRSRRQIVAQRPDQMKFDAAPSRRAEPLAGDMLGSCRRRRHRCSSAPCRRRRGPARSRATSSSQLTLLPATAPCGPITCGRITEAAPAL